MILLDEQIRDAIEAETYTIPNVTVKAVYDPNSNVNFPLVTLDELASNDGIYVDGQPRIVSNRYIVECYCRATDLGVDGILSPRDSARTLGVEIDTFLNQNFNFSQFGDTLCIPINADKTVYRWVARYDTVIDQNPNNDPDNAYMYR